MSVSPSCSFCEKSADEVKYIIAAHATANICDECALLCLERIAHAQHYPSYALHVIERLAAIATQKGKELLESFESKSDAAH